MHGKKMSVEHRNFADVPWLVVLGGSKSKLPFIEAAHALGFKTFVLDNNPDAPGLRFGSRFCVVSLHNPEAVVSRCNEFVAGLPAGHRLAGCIAYVSHAKALESGARLRRAFSLTGVKTELLNLVGDREQLFRVLRDLGVAVPISLSVPTVAEARRFVQEHGRAVLKPVSGGCGGRGVGVVDDGFLDDVFAAAAEASSNGLVSAEVFCHGPEYVINGFVSGACVQVLLCARKRKLGNATTVKSLEVVTDETTLHSLTKAARKVAKGVGLDDSFFSMDVIDYKGDMHIVDVGVLLDAKVDRLLNFTGYSIYETACKVAAGENVAAKWITKKAALRFLYTSQPGRFSISEREAPGVAVEWEREPGDMVGKATDVSDAVGWIIATGENSLEILNSVNSETLFHVESE